MPAFLGEIKHNGGNIREKLQKASQSDDKEIRTIRGHTKNVKDKYSAFEILNKYSEGAGFKEVLIIPQKINKMISTVPLSNIIAVEESTLPNLEKIHDFAPGFFDKAMKQALGSIDDKISGHEQEHSKDLSLKAYEKIFNNIWSNEGDMRKVEFYTESQRILKHSKNSVEAIDNIATYALFYWMLDVGIEQVLAGELDVEFQIKGHNKSPDETSVQGFYPYLNEKAIKDLVEKVKETRNELKQEYEDRYGKIL